MSTGGAVARQLEHPGSERGEHPLLDRHRWVGGVERIEIVDASWRAGAAYT